MYVRNCLHAGDFLEVVPVGLPLTLQYNENGILDKVFKGFKPHEFNISDDILSTLQANNTVPMRISIKDGTTWIKGVLYTATQFSDEGALPESICSSSVQMYKKHPDQFNFFAGAMESLAASFRGASPIRQWLKMTGFNILPGWLVPANMTKSNFIHMISSGQCTFRLPMLSSYIVYRGSEVLFISTDIRQYVCKGIRKFVDPHGCIKAELSFSNADSVIVHYSDVVGKAIQVGGMVVVDAYEEVLCTNPVGNKKLSPVAETTTCDFCNKIVPVPKSGICRCNDSHCMSNQYDRITHFLSNLNLPTFGYEEYRNIIDSGAAICFTDILIIDPYKDLKIKSSLSALLRAIVPDNITDDSTVFTLFANRCNNSLQSAIYYINHPDRIVEDLGITDDDCVEFVKWLYDAQNASDIITIIESGQVDISETNQKFAGDPIFRGKTIMITGKFNHGDYAEITAILQSYSAAVVTDFSESVNCVLVGDIPESVNGMSIKRANLKGIPVMEESVFFQRYEIDSDIRTNLE